MYPYAHKVNYSRLGFVVHENTMYRSIKNVLNILYDISNSLIEEKRKYAMTVKNMFYFHSDKTETFYAQDHILSELCENNLYNMSTPIPLKYLL